MTNRTIEIDTIFFTGYQQVAKSCWLKITPVGREEQGGTQYGATTRNGFLCREFRHNIMNDTFISANGLHLEIDPDLNNDPRRLMDWLANIWQRYPNTAKVPPYGYHPSPIPSVHYYYDQDTLQALRPEHSKICHLLEDTVYRVQMDWAFPYLLHSKEQNTTRIYPFELAPSRVSGRTLDPTGTAHWNKTYLVRFRRADDWETTRSYVTDILNPDGVTVASSMKPPAQRNDDPSWMTKNNKPLPRLILPHFSGFLLLQKLFFKMLEAYDLLNSYLLAKSNFIRDKQRLKQLDHLFDLAGRSTSLDNPRKHIGESFRLIDEFISQIGNSEESLEQEFEQIGGRSGRAFNYIHNFFDTPGESGFVATDGRDWHHFTHFLGPLTFLELAVWLMRHGPLSLKQEFYDKYGGMLFERTDGLWEGADSQRDDPMLVDTRHIGVSTIPDLSPMMSWTKRSIKVYASVNQMFSYQHAYKLWHTCATWEPTKTWTPSIALEQFGLPDPPTRMFDTVLPDSYQVKEFVRFLVKETDEDAFSNMYSGWLSETYDVGNMVSQTPADVKRTVRKINWHARGNMPAIASAVDAFQRLFHMMEIVTSIDANESWTGRDIFELAHDTFHLVDASAKLLGAADKAAFKFGFVPILGIIDMGTYTYEGIDALMADDPYVATFRFIQAAGAGISTASVFIAGATAVTTPFGAITVPWSVVAAGIGQLIVLGSELAIWIDEEINEPYERIADGLWRRILNDEPILSNYRELVRRPMPIFVKGSFAQIVRDYVEEKKRWPNYEASPEDENYSRTLQRNIDDLDDFEDEDGEKAFPGPRWTFLEKKDNSDEAVEAYIAYCQRTALKTPMTSWVTGDPPPPLPYSRPNIQVTIEYDEPLFS